MGKFSLREWLRMVDETATEMGRKDTDGEARRCRARWIGLVAGYVVFVLCEALAVASAMKAFPPGPMMSIAFAPGFFAGWLAEFALDPYVVQQENKAFSEHLFQVIGRSLLYFLTLFLGACAFVWIWLLPASLVLFALLTHRLFRNARTVLRQVSQSKE